MSDPRVALVVAPWASTTRPSLGAGIIHASATALGVPCRTHYANVDFSTVFGPAAFEAVAGDTMLFPLGEHLFAVDIFGRDALDSDAFLRRYVRSEQANGAAAVEFGWDTLCALRDHVVPAWLDEWSERLLDENASVVGFSCVFNQVLPSLALARRLKAAKPELITLLGGACVHGAMGREYAAAFPDLIDHVFTGEADIVFPRWLEGHLAGCVRELPGVSTRGALCGDAVLVTNLDASPTPEYDDYFALRERLIAADRPVAGVGCVPFESSRGCWWGAKQHCVFCGLNNEGIAFRQKSVARVVTEVTELLDRHGHTYFAAADNILPHDAYVGLLPALTALGRDTRFFYEIKANVRRDDVATLSRAGVDHVQPGIESFSDAVLKGMRKGVTGAQNVQLLKWLAEFGVALSYNILVGFPGETDADYEEMLALLPRLFHLPPPTLRETIRVEVHRFSPFFDQSEELGIRGVTPAGFYRHLIPADVADLSSIAYFFDHDVPADAPMHRYRRAMNVMVSAWHASRRRMTAELTPDAVCIHLLDGDSTRTTTLDAAASVVFLLCDAATSVSKLHDDVGRIAPSFAGDVVRTLHELDALDAIVRVGDRVVGCVPMARPCSSREITDWIGSHQLPYGKSEDRRRLTSAFA